MATFIAGIINLGEIAKGELKNGTESKYTLTAHHMILAAAIVRAAYEIVEAAKRSDEIISLTNWNALTQALDEGSKEA